MIDPIKQRMAYKPRKKLKRKSRGPKPVMAWVTIVETDKFTRGGGLPIGFPRKLKCRIVPVRRKGKSSSTQASRKT